MKINLKRAMLYAFTVRHLRWEQWVYRVLRRVQRHLRTPPAPAGEVDERRFAAMAEVVIAWGPGDAGARTQRAVEVVQGSFRFLNHTEHFTEIDWNRRHVSHLWSYNLHYFDFACDLAWAYRMTGDESARKALESLLASWMESTDESRNDGWEPYALSVRAINWIHTLLLVGDQLTPSLRARVEESLRAQLAFLERNLEFHILGNHLQKNLTSLVIGGCYFSGTAADRWRGRAADILWREVREQVLPDGTHYERAPMYHAVVLADLLEAAALLRASGGAVPPAVTAQLERMVEALGVLCRPNGRLHLFNDSAHGIAPSYAELEVRARVLLGCGIPAPEGKVSLDDAGYYGWIHPLSGERILVDCGELGPAYQPGHAHCDLLSYELDLAGRPVVVDAGVHGYDGDPFREYARSTRAHNTVTIDEREQSEVWGTFRIARRAHVRDATCEIRDGRFHFVGSYSPYHAPRALHQRRIEGGGGEWRIVDEVSGADGLPLHGYVHFHPDFNLTREGACVIAHAADLRVVVEPFGSTEIRIEKGKMEPVQGWYLPEFGRAIPAHTLIMRSLGGASETFGYTLRAVEL